MSFAITMLRALAYSADLARPLAREAVGVAFDRGLALLAAHRPTRVVAREDYMLRSYLVGRVGKGFPPGTPALLGGLDGSAYLHCIRTPDAGRAHHSHPWETAISVVLAGGYTEEIVAADGSIVTRRREPGSVALINASTYHRIAEIHAPRVWTLFVTGQRTPDRAWYFRRPDGSIVHERDYHANLEAERAAEEAWFAEREAFLHAVPPIRLAKPGEGLTPAAVKAGVEQQQSEWRERGWWRESFGDAAIDGPIGSLAAASLPPMPAGFEFTSDTPGRVDILQTKGGCWIGAVLPGGETYDTGEHAPEDDAAWAFARALQPLLPQPSQAESGDPPSSAPPAGETGEPKAPALPLLSVTEAARAFDAAIQRGGHGVIVSPAATMREAIAAMETLGWHWDRVGLLRWPVAGPIREIRLVDADSKPVRGSTEPMWAHGVNADTIAAIAPLAMVGVPVVMSEAAPAAVESTPPEDYLFIRGDMAGGFDNPRRSFGEPVLASRSATERGLEVRTADPEAVNVFADSPVEHAAAVRAASTLGVPVVQHWPAPTIEKRLSFEDGSVADLLAEDATKVARDLKIRRRWRATAGENMAADHVRRDLGRFELVAATGLTAQPTAPEGYTFETPYPSRAIIIRHGDGYVGSLLANGNAVAHGRELRPAEIERHAAAWAHARAMRGST